MRGVESILLAAWRTLWTGDATIPALVPGGLWLDLAPENGANGSPLATPYAEITIRPEEAQYASGGFFLQTFTVETMVWSNAGPTDGGNIQKAVGNVFDPPSGAALPTMLAAALTGGVKPIRVDQAPGKFELDPSRAKSKDILVAAAAWNVLLLIPR